jgi:cytochrome c nitrite reductase small subunit
MVAMAMPKRATAEVPGLVATAALLLGLASGIGAYTFRYAEGLSYLSADPAACVNCHVMRSQYDGWQMASHHAVAVCVDCHLPHAFVPKYLAKAQNGFRHSREFTMQTFEEPIRVKASGRAILQDNCVRCHGGLLHGMNPGTGPEEATCTHCHFGVGHGETSGLGGPRRDGE